MRFLITNQEGEQQHLWDWQKFREELSAKLIDYNTNGNMIDFQIIEVEKPISQEILDKYGFRAEEIEWGNN